MQHVLAAWHVWEETFPSIVDMGDGLLPTGRAIEGSASTRPIRTTTAVRRTGWRISRMWFATGAAG